MHDKTLRTLGHNAKRVAERHQAMTTAFGKEREAHRKLLQQVVELVAPALPAICTTPVDTGGDAKIHVVCLIPVDRRRLEPGLYLAVGGAFLEADPASGANELKLSPFKMEDKDDRYGCGGVARRWKARGVQRVLRELALHLDRQLAGRAKSTTDKAQARANKVHAILELLDG